MGKPTDLTAEARECWDAAKGVNISGCRYLITSAAWQAWWLGHFLARHGHTEPTAVRAGRGNLMWANGWEWRVEVESRFNTAARVTPHGRR